VRVAFLLLLCGGMRVTGALADHVILPLAVLVLAGIELHAWCREAEARVLAYFRDREGPKA